MEYIDTQDIDALGKVNQNIVVVISDDEEDGYQADLQGCECVTKTRNHGSGSYPPKLLRSQSPLSSPQQLNRSKQLTDASGKDQDIQGFKQIKVNENSQQGNQLQGSHSPISSLNPPKHKQKVIDSDDDDFCLQDYNQTSEVPLCTQSPKLQTSVSPCSKKPRKRKQQIIDSDDEELGANNVTPLCESEDSLQQELILKQQELEDNEEVFSTAGSRKKLKQLPQIEEKQQLDSENLNKEIDSDDDYDSMDDFIVDDKDEPKELIDSEIDEFEDKAVKNLQLSHRSRKQHLDKYISCVLRFYNQKGFKSKFQQLLYRGWDVDNPDQKKQDAEIDEEKEYISYIQSAQKIEGTIKHKMSQTASVVWSNEVLTQGLHFRSKIQYSEYNYQRNTDKIKKCDVCNRSNHAAKFKILLCGKSAPPGWLTENVQEICKKQKKEGEKMLVFYVGSTCKDRVILFHTLNYFINVARKLLKDGLVQWRRDLLIQG
eukprot:TRINITY_DN658_c4_g1_i1.p1 TRINITY_DN658_c4_g1~~TRINITY_DN658_c4_g1_i1.p1  ORF type:complete len:485 (-),score=46.99 TRINITY_DN658_c4_g1_i1:437-1891(-)